MNNRIKNITVMLIFLLIGVVLTVDRLSGANAQSTQSLITGVVRDAQNQPVPEAEVAIVEQGQSGETLTVRTQENGRFALPIPESLQEPIRIEISRAHFSSETIQLTPDQMGKLRDGAALVLDDIVLTRETSPAFWIATAVFILVLVLIATGILHNTLASLVGTALLFFVSYIGSAFFDGLFIYEFEGALTYVDWNVIFLIMGMMIVIAVVERTGIFQWLAFFAYRISGGKTWLLLPILMLITGIASAFLDNVTTMLLMTPISIQIALAIGINPFALIIPEVFASNVVGVSTLIGTPTNILIGSYAGISFNGFLTNQTPGVILALIGLIVYSEIIYKRAMRSRTGDEEMSGILLKKLEERAKIEEPKNLRKAGIVGAGMLVLFVIGEQIHLLPAVTAIMGASALLVWIRPDIEEMIEAVDWTTLVFFITLFLVVGGIQEVGLISYIADYIGRLVGQNLVLAMIAVTFFSAILSTVVANIPFTAAMLPVIGYLSTTIPEAHSMVLFYCLSVGAAMGGNGSLIGASANMVTAGISERAGYPITYFYFLKKGFPALLITVSLAMIWLLLRFLVFTNGG